MLMQLSSTFLSVAQTCTVCDMSVVAFVRFNVRNTGETISSGDIGIQTKDTGTGDQNLKLVSLDFMTSTTVGFGITAGDIIVTGGSTLRTGSCVGYCYLKFRDRRYVLGVDSYYANRVGNNVYIRFKFSDLSLDSQYFIENGP